jgi:branched-chain amino acid transport system permease protein
VRARGRLGWIGLAVALLVLLDVGLERIVPDSSIRQLVLLAADNVMVAVSLNVINGMAGQFSIGHAGFVGIGAYTGAVVGAHLHLALGGGEPTFARSFVVVPAAVLGAAILAGAFGFVVGLPSLRLRGDYLAIVTLAFAEIFRLVLSTSSVAPTAFLAGLGGRNGYLGPDGRGSPLYAGPFWVFGAAALMAVLAWRLKFSGWGRALRALREDEIAAAAVGVDPTRYKLASFVLAAAGAGVAGALLALMRDSSPIVQPDAFDLQASFAAIVMVILGGSGSVTGSILGAGFVTLSIKAIELLQGTSALQAARESAAWLDLDALRMIVYALVVVLMMTLRPEGLLGERELALRS